VVRALIGGVGYPDLADISVSWAVVAELERRSLPLGVIAEDISYNPVAVVQRLDDEPPDARFEVVVVVSAVTRGRMPGTVTAYRWDGGLPDAGQVHRAVTDAVTGIIHVDNTLIVAKQFGALPDRVAVLEIEPQVEAFGEPLSRAVEAASARACDWAVAIAADMRAFDALPLAPLGGPSAVPT
jgi:hydrogenase maturation protease